MVIKRVERHFITAKFQFMHFNFEWRSEKKASPDIKASLLLLRQLFLSKRMFEGEEA